MNWNVTKALFSQCLFVALGQKLGILALARRYEKALKTFFILFLMPFFLLNFRATDPFKDISRNCWATLYGQNVYVFLSCNRKTNTFSKQFSKWNFFIAMFGVFITYLWYNYSWYPSIRDNGGKKLLYCYGLECLRL